MQQHSPWPTAIKADALALGQRGGRMLVVKRRIDDCFWIMRPTHCKNPHSGAFCRYVKVVRVTKLTIIEVDTSALGHRGGLISVEGCKLENVFGIIRPTHCKHPRNVMMLLSWLGKWYLYQKPSKSTMVEADALARGQRGGLMSVEGCKADNCFGIVRLQVSTQ